MDFNFLPATFHFSEPLWLWGMLFVPVVWILYMLFYRQGPGKAGRLKDFADAHLLPHLLAEGEKTGKKQSRSWLSLLAWSLIWTCGLLALAGPRWGYTEVKTFASARDLIILLDLSKSMDAEDVKPSRLTRAQQEIEDITKSSHGTNIGLIAFATVPHLITPITDDKETLIHLLPYLKTDLVYTQGSYLVPALKMAGQMMKSETGNEKNILIISDGGFDDSDADILKAEEALRSQGVRIYAMGMGTTENTPIPDGRNGYLKQGGKIVLSRLEEGRLKRIASDGGGLYVRASYLGDDTQRLLGSIEAAPASKEVASKTTRFWKERFYLFLIPFALLTLPWFRRNAAFPVLLAAFIVIQSAPAHAFDWSDLFLNKNQQGKMYMQEGKFDKALKKFDDPYRRGVAQYKAGNYKEAVKSFQAADRADGSDDARYNLGNSLLMSGDIEDAIKTYEGVLKTNPDNRDAKHNLEIAKKLLKKQKQQQNKEGGNNQKQEASQGGKNNQNGQQDKQAQNRKQDKGDQKEAQAKKSDQSRQEQKRKEEEHTAQETKGAQNEQKEGNTQPRNGEQRAQAKQQPGNQDMEQRASQSQPGKDSMDYNAGAQLQTTRTQRDIDADQWLNRIENDPTLFLKNKFYIESKRSGAKEGETPW
jgi:Ca-activated chloride channel family protein